MIREPKTEPTHAMRLSQRTRTRKTALRWRLAVTRCSRISGSSAKPIRATRLEGEGEKPAVDEDGGGVRWTEMMHSLG